MGNYISTPKSLFSVDQIPDLSGRVVIVTGGNTGIGRETCKALLEKNAKVYLAARNKTKANDAIVSLEAETGGKLAIFLELDLANLTSVRRAAQEFKNKETGLHILFNNAGVVVPPVEQRTADGYDLSFGTNVLGHYLLTTLLLPNLIYASKGPLSGGHARVINTSSGAMWYPPKGGIVWETLGIGEEGLAACKRVGRPGLYAQSKLGNVLFSRELARRYANQGIISTAVHPGAIRTEMMRNVPIPQWAKSLLMMMFYYPASQGALTQLYAATSDDLESLNGAFLIPWARMGDAGAIAKDNELSLKLWSWCEEQVKAVG